MTPRQLALDLPHRPALAREDFLVSPANQAAVSLVDQWPNWPTHSAVIVGPPGSGKSHLASVWQQQANALSCKTADFAVEHVPDGLSTGALVLEDCEPEFLEERAVFHALNLARQQGAHILFTSRYPTRQWQIRLPDLNSRLNAIPQASMLPPDDALLRGVLVKHFADRQIAANEGLISYMLVRMPRSLQFARDIVAEIDARALEEGAEVSRPFVARLLENHTAPGLFEDRE